MTLERMFRQQNLLTSHSNYVDCWVVDLTVDHAADCVLVFLEKEILSTECPCGEHACLIGSSVYVWSAYRYLLHGEGVCGALFSWCCSVRCLTTWRTLAPRQHFITGRPAAVAVAWRFRFPRRPTRLLRLSTAALKPSDTSAVLKVW